MQITTKYNPGEFLFFIHCSKLYNSMCKSVQVDIIHGNRVTITHTFWGTPGSGKVYAVPESAVSPTKEDLFDSMEAEMISRPS